MTNDLLHPLPPDVLGEPPQSEFLVATALPASGVTATTVPPTSTPQPPGPSTATP
jgi:hypothetical protein